MLHHDYLEVKFICMIEYFQQMLFRIVDFLRFYKRLNGFI